MNESQTLKPVQIYQVIVSKLKERTNTKCSKFAKATRPRHFFADRSQSTLPNRSISLHSLFERCEGDWPAEGQPVSKTCSQEENKGLLCHLPVASQSKKYSYSLLLGQREEVVSALDLCFEFYML